LGVFFGVLWGAIAEKTLEKQLVDTIIRWTIHQWKQYQPGVSGGILVGTFETEYSDL
jgi:hypothetical protein